MIIDGKKIAAEIIAELKSRPKPKGFLAGILIGENRASLSFLEQKEKVAKELGLDFRIYKLSATLGNDKLREGVRKITSHRTCGGALIELPIPEPLNQQYILNVIPREKDVDVLGEKAIGAFCVGRNSVLPLSAETTSEILKRFNFDLRGKKVAVVGTGFLIGQPVALWLTNKVEEVYIVHKGSDFSILKQADLVILGTGQPALVKPSILKDGAGVIDFGYGRIGEKVIGDFDVSEPTSKLSFYTPVPGGTGPILVAKLFENFYKLNAD